MDDKFIIAKNLLFNLIPFFIQTYRLVMGSLLIIFTPQYCPKNITNICSIYDNLKWNNNYYDIPLIFNFITLCIFIAIAICELIRENILVNKLTFNNKYEINTH
jgi:hypothetical protein